MLSIKFGDPETFLEQYLLSQACEHIKLQADAVYKNLGVQNR